MEKRWRFPLKGQFTSRNEHFAIIDSHSYTEKQLIAALAKRETDFKPDGQ